MDTIAAVQSLLSFRFPKDMQNPMDRLMNRDWQQPVRYPDPAIEVLDRRFAGCVLGSAALERLWVGGRWNEGPVWFGDWNALLWSDIPNDRMLRWQADTGDVTVYRTTANYSNGNTRDRQGRLVTCEHGTRRVTRGEFDGSITVLMDHFEGKPLNAPNDVVVHPDGGIWFTDPGYGTLGHYEGHKGELELPTRVYRIDPNSGGAEVMDETLEKPNGLAFSPDYSILYVSDTGASHKSGHPRQIHQFSVLDGNKLGPGSVFCGLGDAMPDGFRVDTQGNVWSSAGWAGAEQDGVQVFAPDGDKIGAIHLPEGVSNVCFGGVKRNRLFMTGGQSIYSLYVDVQGMPYI
jgi:gluconolactonase